MENSKVQEIIEKQVLMVAKAVEDKIDDEIHALDRLDLDDIDVLRERCLQQMKNMAENTPRSPSKRISSPSLKPAIASSAISIARIGLAR
ncbi:hypothetical protein CsSME_00050860 [Camellia sinensis var. sinensis]